jgi:class 3 adenylate cyclase/tetratricopeptide (TPR) repeat protein
MPDKAPHAIPCGFENPPGAQFCGTCGRPLAVTCGRCGTEVSAGFKFCTACGTPLTETQSHHLALTKAPADSPPVGPKAVREAQPEEAPSERRLVSVLFCDLENFTTLAESLDPEEVRDILSRYFEAAREIVARHGGAIEKFIGDAVVGVWGTPVAREDDAERAVRAALEIVAAVAALRSAALPKPLAARAAVATGESAVVLGLENQGMVAGDIMNTAARLQGAAKPGSVLINDATRRATASVIQARPAGTQRLKGKATPVHTWLALRPVAAAHRDEAQAPLVGRHRELEELTKAFYALKRSGRGRLVSVVGIAGIGKTRLVREMERRLRVRHTAVAWYAGRAPWHGAGTAFAPLAEMTRHALDIGDEVASEVGIRKLRSSLEDLVPDERERDWLVPRLAVLIDPDNEGEYAREELFAAWGRLFEVQAEERPVVMVFEDAQRAEPALLDFVEYLVNAAFDRPLMVVTLARPELLEQRPGWGAGLRNFSSLHVGRLTAGEITQLLTGLAPGLTRAAASRIVRRADGVPLYAVEIARMREGVGAGRGGTSGDDVLPTSLHALIAARIDGLGEVERSLLMSAAVLGRRFTAAALAAVAGTDREESARSVERLIRQEMLTRDRDVRVGAVAQLAFQEQLVRDVAYRTLARAERQRRHLRAADYLEGLNDEELVEQVGDHLLKAFQADPAHPQAAAIADRARPALARAARRARAVHAPDRALDHLNDALTMVVDDAERASILEEAASAAQAAGTFEVAESDLRSLVQLQAKLGNRAGAARASARLAGLFLVTQRNDAALGEVEVALVGLGDAASDDAAGVELANQLARAHLTRGDISKAADWAARALESAERLDLPAVATDALITRGAARVQMGDEAAGLDDLNDAIARCSASGMLGHELRARNNIAWLLAPDDPARTLAAAREGYVVARQKNMRDWATQLASVAVVAAVDTGDWDWALATIRELEPAPLSEAHRIDIAATHTILRSLRGMPNPGRPLKELGHLPADLDPQVHALTESAQAWVAFTAGRYRAATGLARQAAEAAVGLNRHAALVLAARSALWARDPRALESLLEMLRSVSLPGRATAAGLRTLEAGAAALAGGAGARARYRNAIAAWQDLDLPLPLLLALVERRTFLSEPANAEPAIAELRDRLGATGLRRLIGG